MPKPPVSTLIRPLVRGLHPYVPGEQPKVRGLIKLNTNENPYPPSPKVLAAVRAATDGRLRLYPNPTADGLRSALAKLHGCAVENLIVGNGSDELLALAIRAFVEPKSVLHRRRDDASAARTGRFTVQYFTPSYSLYPVLTDIHGALRNAVPLPEDFGIPSGRALAVAGWQLHAALSLVTTPNAPSGRGYASAELDDLCRATRGVVVLDEAYVDFAREHAMTLAFKHPHVLVSRTFSKAYSLCFQRVGYMVGHPELIAALHRIRDSYNVNGLGQVAAEATLRDLPHYRRNLRRLIATRERLAGELAALGFDVLPSQTNFLFAAPPGLPAGQWLEQLRARKILVRWFDQPGLTDRLRITIGTETEADALVRAVRAILKAA
ncbi:MAG: pyridoxal phosphate-dependent aminotransferase [Limisphaerales bacterium]